MAGVGVSSLHAFTNFTQVCLFANDHHPATCILKSLEAHAGLIGSNGCVQIARFKVLKFDLQPWLHRARHHDVRGEQKEACVAYALWFFLGYFGAHNFYLRRTGVAVAQLVLTLTIIGLVINFFWHFIDAFLIPGWVRCENSLLAWTLGASPFAR